MALRTTSMLEPSAVDLVFARLAAISPDTERTPDKADYAPFESLVSVMLSAQSRDAMTERAANSLFAVARTPEAILALQPETLQRLIKDAGLYVTKARNIQAMCRALVDRHDGHVPRTREALMALPGVGRKSADIMLRFVFGEDAIAVDTHVFRVATRLGLAKGRTEEQLAVDLDRRVPKRWRRGAHLWLLDHGKLWCKPRKPRCDLCPLSDLCERNSTQSLEPDRQVNVS